jgi:hypothetical protein
MDWFEEGLKELGLTKRQYEGLSGKERKEINRCLREMGHL